MEDKKIFDKEQWKIEATAVIEDIKPHVRIACLAELEGTNEHVYVNLTTSEGDDFCIRMCKNGFSISDSTHNSARKQAKDFFETPYALLDKISPKYRESFACKLISRLNALKERSKESNNN